MPNGTGFGSDNNSGLAQAQTGGAGSPTPTLAQVYAAGSSNKAVNDVMNMALGTVARFQASANGIDNLPYIGIYDAAGGIALTATGLPGIAQSLATTNGTFGRLFNGYQMVDTGWDGVFAHIGSQGRFMVEQINYKQTYSSSWDRTNPLGQRYYYPVGNSEAFPFPAGSDGAYAQSWDLYNTINGIVTTFVQDGFGQVRYGMWPQQHGVTWQHITHVKFDNVAGGTAVGDGVGWAVFEHDLNHPTNNPRGSLTCTALDLLGNWGWNFNVFDGVSGFTNIATFAKSGITFNVPVSVPSGFTPAISADVDCTALGVTTIVPGIAGKKFYPTRIMTWVVTALTGTATAAGNMTMGTDAGNVNWLSTSAGTGFLTVAAINAGVGSHTQTLITAVPPVNPPVTGQGLNVNITLAPAGVTVLKVKFFVEGFYL